MQTFTGFEYLLIDVANHFGKDKEIFDNRIQWAKDNLATLEVLADEADEPEMYVKSVLAIRRAQRGEPIGHLVGFDSVCSGMQIMSALTGCKAGADATGLVDPNRRADAYTDCTGLMRKRIPSLPDSERDKVKPAVMTVLYGSKLEPKKAFGDGTEELNAFYEAMYELCPGAVELLDDLLNSWQPFALSHDWKLPDGFDAKVRVNQLVEKRIEVDELDHATFTYQYRENEGCEYDRKNAANVVHSFDAYVLRCLIRRCNYDPEMIRWAQAQIERVLLERHMGAHPVCDYLTNEMGEYLTERYAATNMADVRILQHLEMEDFDKLQTSHLRGLANVVNRMLEHKPFPLIAVHDDFKCHPNNMNALRQHYIDIMAELADSTALDDVLSTLYGVQGSFPKKTSNLSDFIRQSNYAIC